MRQRAERPVEPAAVREPRPRIAAFEHVLAVEMGPVAIAGGGRVNDGGALLVIHPLERSERRVGEEKAVELQRRPFARTGEGEFAVQVGVVRIADGRNRRKAVHSAAQDDDDEPRIAGVRRARRRAEEARAAKGRRPPPRPRFGRGGGG
jgi:hypothetical protein